MAGPEHDGPTPAPDSNATELAYVLPFITILVHEDSKFSDASPQVIRF